MNTSRLVIILLVVVFFAGVVAFSVSAASVFDIEFPIPELGNCVDKTECKAYCDDSAHKEECIAFGRKYGLISEQETQKKIKGGPGGCKDEEECHAYCEDQAHQDQCLEYAVKNGLMTKDDAKEIRQQKEKFKQVKEGPGGCASESTCHSYCEDAAHLEECLSFGEDHGLIDKEEVARVRKAGFGQGPGGCKGQEVCHAYCEDASHTEECTAFAVEHGFMSKEEAERANKFAGKTGPGGCKGKECEGYCHNPKNSDACLEFAIQEGLISKEEVARIMKYKKVTEEIGGPGGCKGEECRSYCSDEAHHEECFAFAKKQGLVGKEEEQQLEAGIKIQKKVQEAGGPGGCKSEDECRGYCGDPAHVEECVAFAAAHGAISDSQARGMVKQFTKDKYGAEAGIRPPQDYKDFEDQSTQKFEEFKQLEKEFRSKEFTKQEMDAPPGEFPGQAPGGFKGKSGEFTGSAGDTSSGAREGQSVGDKVGPGGCVSGAECIQYCAEHKDECFKSEWPSQGQYPGPQRGEPHGMMPRPQLRQDIIKEVNPKELPPGFEKFSPEERKQIFNEKFGPPPGPPPEGTKGQHGFEGQGSEGQQQYAPQQQRGEYPAEQPSENNTYQKQPPPPGGTYPSQPYGSPQPYSSGGYNNQGQPPPPPGGMYQQQQYPSGSYQQQPRPPSSSYPSQYPSSGGSYPPPPGGTYPQQSPRPEGSYPPAPTGSYPEQQSGGSYSPPPSGSYQQPSQGTYPSSGESYPVAPSGGGSMPPPPSGSSSEPPPPPPPQSWLQYTGYFANVINSLFRW